jgi:hypothetical protein
MALTLDVVNAPSVKSDAPAKIQIYRGERGGRGGNLFITQAFLRDLSDLVKKAFFATLSKNLRGKVPPFKIPGSR